MMTLYHGSTVRIEQPLAHVGREDLDFGQGFYLTSYPDQAKRWAIRMKLIRNVEDAFLNVYEFDSDSVLKAGYRHLFFEAYDRDWLDFIVESRKGLRPWEGYDLIQGGVADDRVIDTVEDYLSQRITAEQALGQLRYVKPNHQICILNQSVIDRWLKFVDCVSI